MTHIQAVLHTVIYKMVSNMSTRTNFTAYSTAFMTIVIRQTSQWGEPEYNTTWPQTRSHIKLMAIDKVCA